MRIFLKIFFCSFLYLYVIIGCQNNQPKNDKEIAKDQNEQKFTTKAEEKDAQFMVDAISSSYDEVQIADIALNKSMNSEVKKLAQQLKDDHDNIISDLKKMASSKAITVPIGATGEAKKDITSLTDKKMADFDKAWLEKVKDMHEKSIKRYDDASKELSDSDIKTWTLSTIIKIRNHLDMILKLQTKMRS